MPRQRRRCPTSRTAWRSASAPAARSTSSSSSYRRKAWTDRRARSDDAALGGFGIRTVDYLVYDLDLYIGGAGEYKASICQRRRRRADARSRGNRLSRFVASSATKTCPARPLPLCRQSDSVSKPTSRGKWSRGAGSDRARVRHDNGNHILDVHNLKIANPVELETRFNQIPGVVTVGIFANRPADVLLIGSASGVKVL